MKKGLVICGPDVAYGPLALLTGTFEEKASKAADLGFDEPVVLAEAVSFPYCCRRLDGPGTVNIHRVDGPNMLFAALPASNTPAAVQALAASSYQDMVNLAPARWMTSNIIELPSLEGWGRRLFLLT